MGSSSLRPSQVEEDPKLASRKRRLENEEEPVDIISVDKRDVASDDYADELFFLPTRPIPDKPDPKATPAPPVEETGGVTIPAGQ